jgi:hypothetical protein
MPNLLLLTQLQISMLLGALRSTAASQLTVNSSLINLMQVRALLPQACTRHSRSCRVL